MTYLLIGDGRLASHLKFYLQLLNTPFTIIYWSRSNSSTEELQQILLKKDLVVWLAIKDEAIEPFIKSHLSTAGHPCIHFSGSLETDLAYSVHPLMTFNRDQHYEVALYKEIPFVTTKKMPAELIQPFSNKVHLISPEQKKLYHALCVLAGTGTQILNKIFLNEMQKLNLQSDLVSPYLRKNFENSLQAGWQSLTGPFVRNDLTTIENNTKALNSIDCSSLYSELYKLFKLQSAANEKG